MKLWGGTSFKCSSRPRLAGILLLLCSFGVVWRIQSPVPTRPADASTEPSFEERLAIGKRFAFKVASYQFLRESQKEMKRNNQTVELTRLGDSEWFVLGDNTTSTPQDCLVYSFGVAQRDAYTELMAARGCQVFAMDPTVRHPTDWMPNVRFYPWGLANRATAADGGKWSHPVYGTAVRGARFYTLPEIVRRLGHSHRTITALKLDCEGCEFAAFQELVQPDATPAIPRMPNILQIDVEFHFASTLGMVDEEDVARIYYAHVYRKIHRCQLVRQRRHEGYKHDQDKVPQALVDAKVSKHHCCYEMTFICSGRE